MSVAQFLIGCGISWIIGFCVAAYLVNRKKRKNPVPPNNPKFCDEYNKGRQAPSDINPPNTANNE